MFIPAIPPHESRANWVYRCYDSTGRLLYIGVSSRPAARVGEHRREQPWGAEVSSFTQVEYPNLDLAGKAEREAIQTELPLHNTYHKADGQRPKRKPGQKRGRAASEAAYAQAVAEGLL